MSLRVPGVLAGLFVRNIGQIVTENTILLHLMLMVIKFPGTKRKKRKRLLQLAAAGEAHPDNSGEITRRRLLPRLLSTCVFR